MATTLAAGPLDEFMATNESQAALVRRIEAAGFANEPIPDMRDSPPPPFELSRDAYAALYGPTVGDRVRLADSPLWLEVEKDFTVYGDELKFGGGKSFAMAWAKLLAVPTALCSTSS